MVSQALIVCMFAIGQVGQDGPPGTLPPFQLERAEQQLIPRPTPLPDGAKDKTPSKDDKKGDNGKKHDKKDDKKDNGKKKDKKEKFPEAKPSETGHFLHRFFGAYYEAFEAGIHRDDRLHPKKDEDKNGDDKKDDDKKDDDKNGDDDKKDDEEQPKPPRRALPEPWSSPPFPGHEYQGYPLMGVPRDESVYPLMKAIYGIDCLGIGDWFKDNHIRIYGWATASGNFSTNSQTNSPTSYWIVPNSFQLDQAVLRFERETDSVQTDHWDWGFRSTFMYGEDYRYTTAGGWMSDQLLKNNRLYGLDPIEQYFDVYVPRVLRDIDMTVRVGRWVACPDIETQLAPDNYLASHSLLFTYDTYTQTGVMTTFRLNEQNMVQCAITSGTDMAPWYQGATPTGFLGWRWVSKDNNDALYTCLNNFNDAIFRRTTIDGQPAGHDNFNYIVSTWEHRFNEYIHTKTEAYFMWQRDAYTGGTVSIGPPQFFGGGGGIGTYIPGYSLDYGVLNYTMFALTKNDYFTVRNEVYDDPQGERTGFRTLYSSHTIGISHNFNAVLQFRPEIGFYHSYDQPAFEFGTKHNMLMGGFDMTLRF